MNSYDYRFLQAKHPYDPAQIEKVCRIGDFLVQISRIPFLRDRLSLYGGTALNLIHFSQLQRLSVDVDSTTATGAKKETGVRYGER
jgi:predicted nucleotidyltransferase component of viral defense system